MFYRLLAILLLLATPLGADARSTPLKVGVVLDPNGKFTHIQRPIHQGIQLYFDGRRDVEIVLIDASDDVEGQVAAAKRLVKEDIQFVIGHNFSSSAMAFLKALPNDYPISYVSPLATSIALTELRPGVHLNWPDNDLQVEAIARFLAKKGLSKARVAMLVNLSEPYATEMASKLKKKLRRAGTNSITQLTYLKGDEGLAEKAKSLLKSEPAVIFVPSYSYDLYAVYAALVPEIAKLSRPPIIIAGDTVGKESNLFEKLGNLRELVRGNFYFTNGWHPEIDTRDNTKFVKAYTAKFKEAPTAGAAGGYEAAKLLHSALVKAKEKTPSAVNETLKNMSTRLTVGKAKINKRRTTTRAVVLMQVTKDGFKYHGIL